MAIALVATVWRDARRRLGHAQATVGLVLLVVAVLVGAAIGLWRARIVSR